MSDLGDKGGTMILVLAMSHLDPSSPRSGGFADSPGDTSYTYSKSHEDTTSDKVLPSDGKGLHECCSHSDNTADQDWKTSTVSTAKREPGSEWHKFETSHRSDNHGARGYPAMIPSNKEAPTSPILLASKGSLAANIAKKSGSANSPPTRAPS